MISPKARSENVGGFHRRLLTLGQMLDVHPQSPIKTDPSYKDFTSYHTVFRCKSKIPQKTPTNKLSITPSTSTSPLASPGGFDPIKETLPALGFLTTPPLLDSRMFHSRQNTMDSQLLKQFKTRQTPFVSPQEKNRWTLASPKGSPRVSFTSINSPVGSMKGNESMLWKKEGQEKKLPAKRRGLRKSIRAIYSNIVNSPAFKNIEEFNSQLPGTEIEDSEANTLIPRWGYLTKEEKQVANEIENEGKREFQEVINIYNRFHKNHLFEPERNAEEKAAENMFVKSVIPEKFKAQYISSPYVKKTEKPGSPKKNLSAIQTSLAQLDESLIKAPPVGSKFLQEINKSMLKQRRVKPLKKEEEEENLVINDSMNLKKMIEMSESLKMEHPLSEDEKEFFRLVKQNGKKLDIILMLTNKRELVYIRDNRRETPLHWAVKKENYDLVVLLYQYGVDLHAMDIVSRKPLDIARRLQNQKIIGFLEDKMKENLSTNESTK